MLTLYNRCIQQTKFAEHVSFLFFNFPHFIPLLTFSSTLKTFPLFTTQSCCLAIATNCRGRKGNKALIPQSEEMLILCLSGPDWR